MGGHGEVRREGEVSCRPKRLERSQGVGLFLGRRQLREPLCWLPNVEDVGRGRALEGLLVTPRTLSEQACAALQDLGYSPIRAPDMNLKSRTDPCQT